MPNNAFGDLAALALAEELFEATGGIASKAVVARFTQAVQDEGATLNGLLEQTTSRSRSTPGEFGVEIGVSAALAMVLGALKVFFDKYVEKLVDASAEQLAETSISALKSRLKAELSGEDPGLLSEMEALFHEKSQELGLPPSSYEPFLRYLRDRG